MRRKEKFSLKPRDETEGVVQLIQQFPDELHCTKEALTSKLMQLRNINEDTAKANIDCALCLGAIVVLHSEDGELIVKDVVSLKRERPLFLKHTMDLSNIVIKTMTELGGKNKICSCSASEIYSHICLTYDVKSKNMDVFHGLIHRTLDSLYCKGSILRNVGPGKDLSYFIKTGDNNNTKMLQTNGHCNGVTENCLPSTSSFQLNKNNERKTSNFRPKSLSASYNRKSRCVAAKKPPGSSSTGKGELKQLQDSLTQFFTPSHVRRSRLASLSNTTNCFRRSMDADTTVDKIEESKPLDKALEIMIDETPASVTPLVTGSSDGSMPSIGLTGSSTTPSPHRRTDQLQDALTSYFSTHAERRRRHEKGEYLILNNGVTSRRKFDSVGETNDIKITTIKEDEENLEAEQPRTAASPSRPIKTPSSLPCNEETTRTMRLRNSSSIGSENKRSDLTQECIAKRKASKLLKQARESFRQNSSSDSISTGSNSPKKSLSSPFKNGKLQNESSPVSNKMQPPKKSPNVSPFKALSTSETFHAETGWEIPEQDRNIFDKARELAQKELHENCLQIMSAENSNRVYPSKIKIGKYEIDSWYSSPYPQEYIALPVLYICESCLTYLVDEAPHARKCTTRFPPGNEIYRSNNISMFEVDGNLARVYCRNLCLLAKLFMDHKTLYFDVEPFLFYVLTINDDKGDHFVGYFSKEKLSTSQHNLACIVTLPCYQGSGYGRFLIDFSYLLSRRENKFGTPERPLSEFGRMAYQSYWRSAILEELYRNIILSSTKSLTLIEICRNTGIILNDVFEMLVLLDLLKVYNDSVHIVVNIPQLKRYWNRAKNGKSRIWLDEKCLKWSPKLYSPIKDFSSRASSLHSSPIKKEAVNGKTMKTKNNMPKSEKAVGNRRRGRRKILEDDEALPSALKPTNFEPRKNHRGNVSRKRKGRRRANEIFSDDDDEIFNPRRINNASCKDEAILKNNRQKTPSTDDELPRKEKSHDFDKNTSNVGVSKAGKVTKSRRFSNTFSTRRDSSRKLSVSELSSSENGDDNRSSNQQDFSIKEKFRDNRIYSSTECENKSDDDGSSSEYGAPRRKVSCCSRTRKRSVGNRNSKTTFSGRKRRRRSYLNGKKVLQEGACSKTSVENEKQKLSDEVNKLQTRMVNCPDNENNERSSEDSESEGGFNMKKIKKANDKTGSLLRKYEKEHSPANLCLRCPLNRDSNEENDEQDDDVCTASSTSSMSPQLLSDRLSLKNSIQNEEPETINMGGEPDIINMGGEPDEDIASTPTMNVLSPKAPLAPPANVIEEDEQIDDDMQTEGFFSNQTKSNRSVMESSSHASFEQASSHRSFDNTAEDFHAQLTYQQKLHSENFIQRSESFSVGQHYNNYIYNAPSNSSLSYNKVVPIDVSSTAFLSNTTLNNQAYYQEENFSGNESMKIQSYISSTQLHDVGLLDENNKKQIECTPAVVDDRNESDMPVLDARTTPRVSPSSMAHFEPVLVKKLGEDEDDDDAPPQLSPNVPSNDVQPITPGQNEILDESLLHNIKSLPSVNMSAADSSDSNNAANNNNETTTSSLSSNSNSLVNVSYETSKSSTHNKASTSLVNVPGLTPADSTQFQGKYGTSVSSLSHSQQPNYGAYNFSQCGVGQFSAELQTKDANSVQMLGSPSKSESTAQNVVSDLGIGNNNSCNDINATSMEFDKQNMYSSSEMSKLACQKTLSVKTPPQNVNVNGILRNDVISPQEQNHIQSSQHTQQQQANTFMDVNIFQQHSMNPSASMTSNNDVSKHNDISETMLCGYLPPTLAVPNQQPRASSVSAIKKVKRSVKEKPTKTSKKNKSNENVNNHESLQSGTSKSSNCAPNFSPFMSVPFDYMTMAQFAMANSVSNQMNTLAMTNPYYASPAGYFGAAAMSTPSAAYSNQQYHQMNALFYNNSWQQYCGNYTNSPYPIPGNTNSTQLSFPFRNDVSTSDTGSVSNRSGSQSANSAAASAILNAQLRAPIMDEQQQRRNLNSSIDGNVLLSNGWPSVMPSAFVSIPPSATVNAASHAAAVLGAIPSASAGAGASYSSNQQQLPYQIDSNHHQPYSSYSAHT